MININENYEAISCELIEFWIGPQMQVFTDEVHTADNLEQMEDGNLGMTSIRLRL